MATKTGIAKTIAKFVVGISVGYTTGTVIKNNVDPEKRRHKAEAYVGGAVLGTMAAEAAENWTDRKIDSIVERWAEFKTAMKDALSTQ